MMAKMELGRLGSVRMDGTWPLGTGSGMSGIYSGEKNPMSGLCSCIENRQSGLHVPQEIPNKGKLGIF